MNKITWIEQYYDYILSLIPKDTESVLDIGTGSGIFGYILTKTRSIKKLDAIEPFAYDLSIYNNVHIGTWSDFYELSKHNRIDYFDVAVGLEVIEHMKKQDALEFLDKVKKIAKKVIITTPFKFEEQDAYDGNEYQKHRSFITLKEFEHWDYKCWIMCTKNLKGVMARVIVNKKLLPIARLLRLEPKNIIAIWNEN